MSLTCGIVIQIYTHIYIIYLTNILYSKLEKMISTTEWF